MKRSLRRLCFYTCLSVILFTRGGCLLGGGCPGLGGVPAPGESGLGGVPAPGGLVLGGTWRRPPETATAAGGTHPTGMHSCIPINLQLMLINMKSNVSWFKRIAFQSCRLHWTC